jgi:methionyl-tRNA formyltransferase
VQISVASSSLISVPIIEAIEASSHKLASLITLPDRKVGRGQDLTENEIAAWASERGILVAKPGDISQINKHLLEAQPQLVITASYGKLIPPELLHGPRFGWLNLHFSLLPRWRGAAPVQWSILEGDEKTGISIFKLDKGMDTGPIYLQEEVDLNDEVTTPQLLNQLSLLGGDRILEVVEMITKGIKPKAQSQSNITMAPKISKEMGLIQWELSGVAISRLVRAIGDRPGTYTFFRGAKLGIHGVKIVPNDFGDRPYGALWSEGDRLLTRAFDCALEITEVTPAGKKRMKASDFARGARLLPDERFDPLG